MFKLLFFFIALSLSASDMVYIPAGRFIMGLSENLQNQLLKEGGSPEWLKNCTPGHEITLEAFYIDKYEVTNSDYHDFDPRHFFRDMEADMPVTDITWTDACEYAAYCGKRLPSEQEWEKAARGSFSRIYPWGDSPNFNFCYSKSIQVPGYNGLVPVTLFPEDVSTYGVCGMGGNACEWTDSIYLQYPGNKTFNRKYGKNFRVIRGGSFLYDHLESFCSNRKCGSPDLKNIDIGFRCVMSVENYIKKYGYEKHLENLRTQSKN